MRQNRDPFRCEHPVFEVRNADDDEAEMVIYNSIGGWFGVYADEVREQLKGIKAKTIHLRINSPGGAVFEAMAIYNTLKEHPAKIVAHVDGVAASAASLVALAGDELHMGEGTRFMIHNPLLLTVGNAAELRKDADFLDQMADDMIGMYARRSGQERDQIAAWMDEETWFTPQQALDAGFADSIAEEPAATAAATRFDLSMFGKVPDDLKDDGAHHSTPTDREIEQALRDVGLSQIAAKRFVSAGRAAAPQRDAEEPEQRDVASEPNGHEQVVRNVTRERIRAAAADE